MAIKIFKTKTSITKRLKELGIIRRTLPGRPITSISGIRLPRLTFPEIMVEIDAAISKDLAQQKVLQELQNLIENNKDKEKIAKQVSQGVSDCMSERAYLLNFYQVECGGHIKGSDKNGKIENWGTNKVLNSWEGITTTPKLSLCSNVLILTHRVSKIKLGYSNIHAYINENDNKIFYARLPEGIEKLAYLETLDINHNFLNGTLPEKIGQLKHLKTLSLEFNQITGALPSLSGLTSLTYLALDHNRMEGEIKELVKLTKLKTCHIYHNKFYGKVPDELDRKELESFKFYRNYLQWSDRIEKRIAKDFPKWQGKEESEKPAHLVFD